MKKTTMLKKPVLDTNGALKFADGEKPKPMSGLIPDGDVRLTANIWQDLHLRLKTEAAQGTWRRGRKQKMDHLIFRSFRLWSGNPQDVVMPTSTG